MPLRRRNSSNLKVENLSAFARILLLKIRVACHTAGKGTSLPVIPTATAAARRKRQGVRTRRSAIDAGSLGILPLTARIHLLQVAPALKAADEAMASLAVHDGVDEGPVAGAARTSLLRRPLPIAARLAGLPVNLVTAP